MQQEKISLDIEVLVSCDVILCCNCDVDCFLSVFLSWIVYKRCREKLRGISKGEEK